jgi:predicted nucleic acid-binding protein
VKGIADTGLLVAFANRNDDHHRWALEVVDRIEPPFLTCEAVLAETAFHLQKAVVVVVMVREGLVEIAISVTDQRNQLAVLAKKYRDRHPDLADLCLVRLSELHPRHSVVTVDEKDFRVYRRNGRDVIALICPPKSNRPAR